MPFPLRPPQKTFRSAPVTYRRALEAETAGRLRGPAYRRPTRGVYLAAGSGSGPATGSGSATGTAPDDDPVAACAERLRVFRAAVGERAVFGGPSAAFALGVPWTSPRDPVEVVLPKEQRVRARTGLRVRCDRLLPGEVVSTPFGWSTGPARTAFDLARSGSPDRALAWVDALLRVTRIEVTDVERVISLHPRVRGLRQAQTVVALGDPRAESPRESMLRWALLEAGLPAPTPQFVVRDDKGRFVARLDLAWPRLRIAVEYDGAHHRDPARRRRDLGRHNRLRALGWQVFQVDAAQWQDLEELITALRHLVPHA